jgi:hypothetical protein
MKNDAIKLPTTEVPNETPMINKLNTPARTTFSWAGPTAGGQAGQRLYDRPRRGGI